MKTIRHLTIVALVVLAFAVIGSACGPSSSTGYRSSVVATEKSSPANAVTPANAEIVQPSLAAEDVVSLLGRSTYALSTCEPSFTATLNTGIDRQRPAHQPPIA